MTLRYLVIKISGVEEEEDHYAPAKCQNFLLESSRIIFVMKSNIFAIRIGTYYVGDWLDEHKEHIFMRHPAVELSNSQPTENRLSGTASMLSCTLNDVHLNDLTYVTSKTDRKNYHT